MFIFTVVRKLAGGEPGAVHSQPDTHSRCVCRGVALFLIMRAGV